MDSWRLQIYLVSDPLAQELITALLAGFDRLVVEPVSGDFDHFVIVESSDSSPADGLHRLLRSIDPDARLIHTSTAESAEPTTA